MNTAARVERGQASSLAGNSDCSLSVSAAEGYRRWAASYDNTPNPLLACEERHLLPMLPDTRNKRILDLACGTGRWLTKLITQNASSGIGIDCCTAMLDVASRKSVLAGRVVAGTCEVLPFRSSIFDVAICSFALEHMRDLTAIARELARVMKSGADVFISDLHPEAHARGWRVGFRDGDVPLQIETLPRSIHELLDPFLANGFACKTRKSLWLGAPEYSLFAQTGKSAVFAEACQGPAVLVCHLRRGLQL